MISLYRECMSTRAAPTGFMSSLLSSVSVGSESVCMCEPRASQLHNTIKGRDRKSHLLTILLHSQFQRKFILPYQIVTKCLCISVLENVFRRVKELNFSLKCFK